jgi:hypothetical protein
MNQLTVRKTYRENPDDPEPSNKGNGRKGHLSGTDEYQPYIKSNAENAALQLYFRDRSNTLALQETNSTFPFQNRRLHRDGPGSTDNILGRHSCG